MFFSIRLFFTHRLTHRPSKFELEIIKRTNLFNKLNKAQFNQLFEKVNLIQFKEDELIFRENEIADELYIIVAGVVRVFTTSAEGTKIPLALIKEGRYFGEQAIVAKTNKTRNASVEATSKTILIRINGQVMSKIFEIDSELKERLKKTGLTQAFKIFKSTGQTN